MSNRIKEFLWEYRSFLGMSALIGAGHFVWYRIQMDDNFVREDERKPFPLIALFRYFRDRITSQNGFEKKVVKTSEGN